MTIPGVESGVESGVGVVFFWHLESESGVGVVFLWHPESESGVGVEFFWHRESESGVGVEFFWHPESESDIIPSDSATLLIGGNKWIKYRKEAAELYW